MTPLNQSINDQQDLTAELKETRSLVAVCASALRDVGTCEDAPVVDVLLMTADRLWALVESETEKLKALELALEGGE